MDAPYGSVASAARLPAARPIHLTRLMEMQASGEKIAALSAYDATFAATAVHCGVECILVSAEGVGAYQGHASHEDVTLDALAYHVGNIAQGLRSAQASAWVIADLPARCYGASRDLAMRHAGRLVMAGAQMVRLPLDEESSAIASFLTERGVAVCGHVEGMQTSQVPAVAALVAASGARLVVLECMEDDAVLAFAAALPHCLTLGLHAGQETTGQLVSLHALLGMEGRDPMPADASYLAKAGSMQGAFAAYVADVKAKAPTLAVVPPRCSRHKPVDAFLTCLQQEAAKPA